MRDMETNMALSWGVGGGISEGLLQESVSEM